MKPRSRSVSEELIRRYGFPGRDTLTIGTPPTTSTIAPLGPLVEMTVRRFSDGVRERWPFSPRPVLSFKRGSKRLWVIGDGFRFDGDGFHANVGSSGLRHESVKRNTSAMSRQHREYVRTHYGMPPSELVVGDVRKPPAKCVALGEVEDLVYITDRNDGTCSMVVVGTQLRGVNEDDGRCSSGSWTRDGQSQWKHEFVDEHVLGRRWRFHMRPTVCTSANGTGLWFSGGSYTVVNGWLAD